MRICSICAWSRVSNASLRKQLETPKTKGAGYRSIRLLLDPQSGLPVGIDYDTDGAGTVEIKISKITPDIAVAPDQFTFDKKKYKDVEIIDFR